MIEIPVAIVVSLKVNDVDEIPRVLDHIKPTTIPGFAGQVRIVVGTDVRDLIDWLENDTSN